METTGHCWVEHYRTGCRGSVCVWGILFLLISPFFTVSSEDRSPNFLSSQNNNALNILQKQYLRTHHMPDYGDKYLHILSSSVFWNSVALGVQNYAWSYFLMKRQSPGGGGWGAKYTGFDPSCQIPDLGLLTILISRCSPLITLGKEKQSVPEPARQ